MNFRIIDFPDTKVVGLSKEFDRQAYPTREALRHEMWSEDCDSIPEQLCEGRWNQPGNHSYDGIWYGLWRNGRYMIARASDNVQKGDFETQVVHGGMYAVFSSEPGKPAWEAFPALFASALDAWLPTSGYRLRNEDLIEVYYLDTDHAKRKAKRRYELWLPIS